jgi:hypothetical protein
MRLPTRIAILALFAVNAAAFGQMSPPNSLKSGAPTIEVLKDLESQLASAPQGKGLDRLRRVELAARIIQVDLLLGDEGSKKFADAVIRPARALEALDALQALNATEINDLKSTDTRRAIWDAIAYAHPAYRLFVEAVRLAGHEDDPEILERTLKPLLSSWTKGGSTRPLTEIRQPLGEWGRDVLCDCLRIQAIADAEGALRLTAGFKTIPESKTKRPRAVGTPPVMNTRPFPQLRASGKITQFDRAMHMAAALQRAGHKVSFWSVAAERNLDATTKTVAQEPIIIYPEQDGKDTLIAIGSDALAKLKGEEIHPGVYRFTSPAALENFLIDRVQFRVLMTDVLDAHASPAVWAGAMQRFLTTRTGAADARELLIDLNYLDPWAGFTTAAAASLEDAAQSAFARFVEAQNIKVAVSKVKDHEAEPAVTIRDLKDREKELVFPHHEAILARAFHLLPPKFFSNVEKITLQAEPTNEKHSTTVREGDKLITREVDSPLYGRGWSNRFMLAKPLFDVSVHELTHCWALSRFDKFKIGDWEGTAVDAFNEISWQRLDGKWIARGEQIRSDDFARPNGGASENEDIAVESEYYVVRCKALRDHVRAQLKRGNLVPAVKYLYIKQIAFLDMDGKCLEFETDGGDPPFAREEFDKAVKAMEARKPLTGEQKRLRDHVALIFALAAEMVKSKRVVSAATNAFTVTRHP